MFVSVLGKAIRRVRRWLLWALFWLFDRILPVRDDYWCFCTWGNHPHTLDNPRAVFEEVKDDPTIRKIIIQKAPGHLNEDGSGVVFLPSESIAAAYFLARSRVIVIGYALRGLTSFGRWLGPPRHQVIQLWHGVPLKRIGHLFPGEDFWSEETPRYAAAVCSSPKDQDFMAGAFSPLPIERVWLTGLPRNDLICKKEEDLPSDYREQLEQLDQALDGRRLVLYAPTWRKDLDTLFRFSREQEEALERLLLKRGAVLGVRGHPIVRRRHEIARSKGVSAILSVNHLPEANLILRRTAVLITDYSSIYIDFLLLNRPIIHFTYDLETYVQERGFLYEVDEAFAGGRAMTFEELINCLDAALEDPSYEKARREESFRLFHDHADRPAAEVALRIKALSSPRTTQPGNL